MQQKREVKVLLADSFKELVQEKPVEKITIKEITDRAGVIRVTFYNHFQDKYELMNWIFDMEFIGLIGQDEANQSIEEMTALLRILYDNRCFYRNALSVQGQNSLIEHIREIAMPLLHKRLQEAMTAEDDSAFYIEFFLDALLGAIIRWINREDCEPPEEFIPHFFSCIISTAKYILKKYSPN